MNILVVDDARAVHAFMETAFAGSAYTLNHVYNGQQACELIRQNPSASTSSYSTGRCL